MVTPDTGVVVIGRNEGERLIRCLDSLAGTGSTIVYVDSGSTDRSVAEAQARGASVIALDMTQPFTAARARNAGFAALTEHRADLGFVQFVDGDCEVDARWPATARRFLDERDGVAVVCGRRKERFPEASIYNRMCDEEWDTSIGEATACGGDALMRIDALRAVGGYRDALVAGEEPELCARLRAAGWTIWRIDAPMTLHDAAILRFRQWWTRALRGGYAYAQVRYETRGLPQPLWGRELVRALAWGAALPIVAVAGMVVTPWTLPLTAALVAAQIARVALRGKRRGQAPRFAWTLAALTMTSKVAEAVGAMRYALSPRKGRASAIEYK